jgi:predicted dehydrogenase
MKRNSQISRRELLAGGAAAFTILPPKVLGRGAAAPSEKLNIAFIGLGCRGWIDLKELSDQNVVAICDCDWRPIPNYQFRRACEVAAEYPQAKKYDDWRIMLEEQEKHIDAVVVATPDHSHAMPAITAMKMKKHVYVEKPLCHSMSELKAMTAAAHKYNVATQTGNQGHSSEDCRLIVEWIRDGAIGTVKEAHLFQSGGSGRNYDFIKRVDEKHEIPKELNWDLWLGPAPDRRFNPMYLPNSWRRWLDFGTGTMGDYNCHYLDPVAWALDLGMPNRIEANHDPLYDPETNRQSFAQSAEMIFDFPAVGSRPPVKVYWHMGGKFSPPKDWPAGEQFPGGGGVIVGSKGSIVFGALYASLPLSASTEGYKPVSWGTPGKICLIPEALDKEYKRPPKSLPRVRSHWVDWVESAKAGRPAGSNFDFGGILTGVGLLGNIACRQKGKVLYYDEKKGRFTNNDEANALLTRKYRDGWKLPS